MPQSFPGKSVFAGLFNCPKCGAINHFSYLSLSEVDSLDIPRRCSSCGQRSELRQYKIKTRSFK